MAGLTVFSYISTVNAHQTCELIAKETRHRTFESRWEILSDSPSKTASPLQQVFLPTFAHLMVCACAHNTFFYNTDVTDKTLAPAAKLAGTVLTAGGIVGYVNNCL